MVVSFWQFYSQCHIHSQKFTKEMYIKLITLQYERHLFYPYLFLEYPQLPYYISVWQLLVDICTSTKYIYICSLLSSIQGSPKNKRLNFYFYLLFRVHLRVKVKVHLFFYSIQGSPKNKGYLSSSDLVSWDNSYISTEDFIHAIHHFSSLRLSCMKQQAS